MQPAHASDRTKPAHAAIALTGEVSAKRLDATSEKLDGWLDRVASSGSVSGLAVALVSGNEVVYENAIGFTDVESKQPVTPDTVFRIASLSKAFASALAGQLVRHKVLSWNTRIADLLPFFQLETEAATRQVTVGDLLSHRVGLPHNTYDVRLEEDVPYEKLVRELDQIDLICDVGDCYSYQNVAFSLFGNVVYAVTGDFFNHQVGKRLFQPLGMDQASYGRAALESNASWAKPHVYENGNLVPLVPKPTYYHVPPAAGVNASIRDLEKWLIAQMGGRPDVLPPTMLSVLHRPVVETPWQTRYSPWRRGRLRHASYALGWRIYDYAGHTMIYHAGAIEGYRALIGFLPDSRIGMVMLWNCSCTLPAGLLPMAFDEMLGLPSVDWAGIDKLPATRLAHRR